MGESAQLQAPEETRTLIEGIARGEAAARLRSQVAQWHPEATLDQVEDAFQEACLLAVCRARGRSEGEVFTWIRTTTTRKVSEIVEAARREQPAGATVADLGGFRVDAVEGPERELIEREDEADLERLMTAVLERLSERQRNVVALHTRGQNRPQIAGHLRLTVRTVKRELDRIVAVGRSELASFAGHGCEDGETLVSRFAFGLASSSHEVGEAQLHLATCSRCTAFYERLDAWHHKAAAMLPLPAAETVDPGIVERTIHAAVETASGLKQQLVDGGAQVKQHATTAYYRAVDPTPLSAARPGAAVTAISGCLALGGGATYCAQQGVDPLRELSQIVAPMPKARQPEPKQPPPSPPPPVAEAPTPRPAPERPASPPQPESSPGPQQAPTPTPASAPAAPSAPSPSPGQEFDPAAGSAQAAPQLPTPTPAPPASAGGGSEFGGP